MIVLIGGIFGGARRILHAVLRQRHRYPINIGGRPLNSWPAFIPITFEMTVLFAAFAAVLGMLALNGLPQPYHPLFNVPSFATRQPRQVFHRHRTSDDPKFICEETRSFLESLRPHDSDRGAANEARPHPAFCARCLAFCCRLSQERTWPISRAGHDG